jgi:hypothetical protein
VPAPGALGDDRDTPVVADPGDRDLRVAIAAALAVDEQRVLRFALLPDNALRRPSRARPRLSVARRSGPRSPFATTKRCLPAAKRIAVVSPAPSRIVSSSISFGRSCFSPSART